MKLNMNATSWAISEFHTSPEEYDLNAPYQRSSVWTMEQRKNLIKSYAIGIPIPSIVLSEMPQHIIRNNLDIPFYRIVDGKQRIETIQMFFDNKFSVPAEWFISTDFSNPSHNKKEVFSSDLLTGWKRITTTSVVIGSLGTEYLGKNTEGSSTFRNLTEQELIQRETEVYLLLNNAGVAHTSSELEKAETILNNML